jgi:hypothetical protein
MPVKKIVSLEMVHEFFGENASCHITLTPTWQSSLQMNRNGILIVETPNGIDLFSENGLANCEIMFLRFEGWSSDARFPLYTAEHSGNKENTAYYVVGKMKNLHYQLLNRCDLPEEQIVTRVDPKRKYGAKEPDFIVDIPLEITPFIYKLTFHSKEMYWKYLIFGSLNLETTEIVGKNNDDVLFVKRLIKSPPGVIFLSGIAFPMRCSHEEKFSLHDSRNSGKVLIRRLPVPDYKHVGIELNSNGENIIVAEIYPKV